MDLGHILHEFTTFDIRSWMSEKDSKIDVDEVSFLVRTRYSLSVGVSMI